MLRRLKSYTLGYEAYLLWLEPYADAGLESSGDGGGTVVSSFWTMRNERLLRGLVADALKAWWISCVEKESLRGSCADEAGIGMVSVMVDVRFFERFRLSCLGSQSRLYRRALGCCDCLVVWYVDGMVFELLSGI